MNSVIQLLERAERNWPDRTAVLEEQERVTYAEYADRARRIGTGLLRRGAGGRPVVVYLPKSILALTVFFGAMYAACPYAPTDAHIPPARLAHIVRSLSPCTVVTNGGPAKRLTGETYADVRVVDAEQLLTEEADGDALQRSVSRVIDTDPLYVMFTSGSTGKPKGVTIPHRGILDYAAWVARTFAFDETTVMGNQAPLYFDNSTFDIYGALYSGASLVLIPEPLFLFPSKLPEYLGRSGITSIFWVPTVMISVANSGALDTVCLPKLKNVAFCGEVMPNRQLNVWRRALPHCSFANLYGPTEITDVCCCYKVDRAFEDAEPLPIGRARENMRVLILREDGTEAAPMEQGELCVIGSGVALGYWNAPELTARVFTQNPCETAYPERMYRTGDRAYRDAQGLIWFCGRRDSQIKLKGNRIELGEIESAAMQIDGVENAAAIFDREAERIALFLQSAEPLTRRSVVRELKKRIPGYMLPGLVSVLPRLPCTANDKIDRVRLENSLRVPEEGGI